MRWCLSYLRSARSTSSMRVTLGWSSHSHGTNPWESQTWRLSLPDHRATQVLCTPQESTLVNPAPGPQVETKAPGGSEVLGHRADGKPGLGRCHMAAGPVQVGSPCLQPRLVQLTGAAQKFHKVTHMCHWGPILLRFCSTYPAWSWLSVQKGKIIVLFKLHGQEES